MIMCVTVRGLEYDEDPDYDRCHGIFYDLLDPYTGADEPFDFASSRNFEDVPVDDHLIDGPADWPKVSISNHVEDDENEDCRSCRYRRHTSFMPNSSWPNPAGVKEEDLFGDEDKMQKGRVDIVSMPPSILEGGYVDVVYPEYEEMVLIYDNPLDSLVRSSTRSQVALVRRSGNTSKMLLVTFFFSRSDGPWVFPKPSAHIDSERYPSTASLLEVGADTNSYAKTWRILW
jgi:hypothetical protein